MISNNNQYTNLSQDDWSAKAFNDTNGVILDVRTAEECASGIIPNALMLDIMKGQGFIYELEKLDNTKNYYVYCRSGNRSGQACNVLKEMGFNNCFNLIGGMMEWQGEVVQPKTV